MPSQQQSRYEGDPKYRMVTDAHFKDQKRKVRVHTLTPEGSAGPDGHLHEITDLYALFQGPGVWKKVERDVYVHPSERQAYMALVNVGKITVTPP